MPISKITTLSAAPTRQDPTTFDSKADALLGQLPTMVTELNTVTGEIDAAGAMVDDAQAAANTAVATVNATKWATDTPYTAGDVVWSPIDFLTYRRKITGAGSTDPSADAANWKVLTTTIFNDAEVRQCMMRDVGYTFVDKGDSGTDAQVIDFSAGTHQRIKATGNFAMSFTGWPPDGNFGEVLLELVADGTARVITFPAGTKFLKTDGTTTTVFSEINVTLQSALDAIDFILFWTRDCGTTLYCRVIR